MLNVVALNGRLTKDPEVKVVTEKSVVNFTLAVNRNYKNKDGEVEADFIQCQAWDKPAEFIGSYVKKGNLVSIAGSIHTRTYEKDAVRHYVTEINVNSVQQLEKKKDTEDAPLKTVSQLKEEQKAEWDKRSPGLDAQAKDNLKKELTQKYQPQIDALEDNPF
jgi:single-strand DNA-binding protein